jgi:hypothetical protein
MSVESCLLAALNRTRKQAVLSIVAAIVNIALSIALVRHIGSLGVIGGTILSYLFVLVVPQSVIVRSLFRRELAGEGQALFAFRSSLFGTARNGGAFRFTLFAVRQSNKRQQEEANPEELRRPESVAESPRAYRQDLSNYR